MAFRWIETRPGTHAEEVVELTIVDGGARFALDMEQSGHRSRLHADGDPVRAMVVGSAQVSDSLRTVLALDREDGRFWRNYYLYLIGLPVKLADAPALLPEEVADLRFQAERVRAFRIRYADSRWPWWEFYVTPNDARLVGARFWNEGPEADGGHIVFEGLTEGVGLRLPAERTWYTNAEGRLLRTDRLVMIRPG